MHSRGSKAIALRARIPSQCYNYANTSLLKYDPPVMNSISVDSFAIAD